MVCHDYLAKSTIYTGCYRIVVISRGELIGFIEKITSVNVIARDDPNRSRDIHNLRTLVFFNLIVLLDITSRLVPIEEIRDTGVSRCGESLFSFYNRLVPTSTQLS